MKFTSKDKKICIFLLVAAILYWCVLNTSKIGSFLYILWSACSTIVFGAFLAYVVNLPMKRIEMILKKRKNNGKERGIALLLSIFLVLFLIGTIFVLVVPTMIEATDEIVKNLPSSFEQLKLMIEELFSKNSYMFNTLEDLHINWEEVFNTISEFLKNGIGNVLGSTISIISSFVSGIFNSILISLFSIYFLLEKERFIRLYHRLTNVYCYKNKEKIDKTLGIINQTFSSFIGGECIEAMILSILCATGMYILHLPYPFMIGILVGTINIIPMIGAYIGGAIGAFLVLTINPVQALLFLVYLCIIQQIESNLIYPRVVGKSVGLPGIYVLMTVVVGGVLAGVAGMLLGIPMVASLYKILKIVVSNREQNLGL